MNTKLATKADLREVDRAVPQKVDEVYRQLMTHLSSMQKDIGRAATKEEFHVLLATKVSIPHAKYISREISTTKYI
jgi:hypothetical protein